MRKKILVIMLTAVMLLFAVLPLSACREPVAPAAKNPLITITLESGEYIKLELFPDIAPITVENFLKYVNDGFYDGVIFHRIIANFMIQTGGFHYKYDKLEHKNPTYESIVGEFLENGINNTLKHSAGVISMARTGAPNSATSQFFICTDMPKSQSDFLDNKYAAFGKVTDTASLNVVRRLANTTTSTYYDDTLGTFENFPYSTIKIVSIVQNNK